jgi:hypothetical protein
MGVSMSTELATKNATGTLVVRNMDDLARLGNMLAASGYFKDAADSAQAGVKVLAGLEMGIGAFSAMSGIHIIEGKPSVGAGLMAAAVKRHPKYNYRVTKHTTDECVIDFYEGDEIVGTSSFTIADAKKAELKFQTFKGAPTPWAKSPRNMLFARALSNGVRWYCPDVFDVSTYTPEELGAEVDDEGNIIDVAPAERPVKPSAPALEAPAPEPEEAPEAPEPAEDAEPLATGDQLKAITRELKKHDVGKADALGFFRWFTNRELGGATELTAQEATGFLAMVARGEFEDKLAAYADHTSFSEDEAS